MRIGHGYDVHRLVDGRKLILGGVEIPFEKGLDGHSDADVLTHAVMDALLGAAALGDIGKHFPDNDVRYLGADSIELLKTVSAVLTEHGWRLGNLDATVIAQRPSGKSLSETGVTPDVVVDLDDEQYALLYYNALEQADDPQFQAAIDTLTQKIS